MKRGIIFICLLISLLSLTGAKCDLNVSLINQDPYPAVPGDYVKLVFQVTGTDNPDCAFATIELLEKYPIKFDPGESSLVQIKGGTFQKDYNSYLMVPYKIRLDPDALDGETPIEIKYGSRKNLTEFYNSKTFDIEVKDTHADFEIFVKDYDSVEGKITFEVLNIASVDVKAISLEIPQQQSIELKGAKTNIIGDLDSNEYTTADFNIEANQGKILIKISYSDSINERRTIEKTVSFNPDNFTSSEKKTTPWYTYLIVIVFILLIIYYFYNKKSKKKQRAHRGKGSARLG